MSNDKTFKILSLDGGGVFGIGQVLLLSLVSDLSKFNVFAGTSIGSVIAAFIAQDPASAVDRSSQLVELFNVEMDKIFKATFYGKIGFTPKYSDKHLNKTLQKLFPGCLGDIKEHLFITAADLSTHRLKVFYSRDYSDQAYPLWEVLRLAVAAETYFLPWKGMADGGVYANNPSMAAVAGTVHACGVGLDQLELCSIGTGSVEDNDAINSSTFLWPTVSWGTYLIKALLSGAANIMHEYFVRSLRLPNYLRIQFKRERGWDMSSVGDMRKAVKLWKNDIISGAAAVERF